MRYTRREFLERAAGVGLALGAAKFLPGCGSPLVGRQPALPDSQANAATGKPSRVAAVRGQDLYDMTRAALAAFGGAAALVQPGQTVFIKPNLIGAGSSHHPLFTTGEATKPEIILTVAEECLKAGAARVIIGDGAQVTRFDWNALYTLDGATSLSAAAAQLNATYSGQVELACLNADSPEWDAVPAPYSGLGEIVVSSLVRRADRIISLPVLKTHRLAQLTLSLKNFMGVTSLAQYGGADSGYRLALHSAPGGLEQSFLDIVAGVRPDFTLIDASIGCEGNGPYVLPGAWGATVDVRDRLGDWLMLASRDLVAADATAARIIGADPAGIAQLQRAYERGLGEIRAEEIQLDGATLDELRMPWKPAEPITSPTDLLEPTLALQREQA